MYPPTQLGWLRNAAPSSTYFAQSGIAMGAPSVRQAQVADIPALRVQAPSIEQRRMPNFAALSGTIKAPSSEFRLPEKRPAPIDDIGRFAHAIGQVESSGRYDAVGPETGKGRAYGKYQVMDFNIGPWTREVLGAELSSKEFLANPRAQDAVFRAKFGQSLAKHGNPEDAASIWFTGRPLSQGKNRQDVTGTTGSEYVNRFRSHLG